MNTGADRRGSEVMSPGRDLDVLIAEKVMGVPVRIEWAVTWTDERGRLATYTEEEVHAREKCAAFRSRGLDAEVFSEPQAEPYSTDIAAAWTVAEKVRSKGFTLSINEEWIVWFEAGPTVQHRAIADTAPHAICLAALKAMGSC